MLYLNLRCTILIEQDFLQEHNVNTWYHDGYNMRIIFVMSVKHNIIVLYNNPIVV